MQFSSVIIVLSQSVKRKKDLVDMLDLVRPEVKPFYEKLPTDDVTLTIDFDIEDMFTENEPEIQSFELEEPNNDAQEQEQTPIKKRTSKSVNKKCIKKSKKEVTETRKPLVNNGNKTNQIGQEDVRQRKRNY